MQPRVRFVAVDAPFLISLAKGDPACETAVDFVTRRLRFYIAVPPAAHQALFDIIDADIDQAMRDLARNAERSISTWGFVDDDLTDLQEIIAAGAARLLHERTDLLETPCRMLAETSVLKCAMLLSDDSQLTQMDSKRLEILLMDRDLDGFLIIDPETFSEAASAVLGDV